MADFDKLPVLVQCGTGTVRYLGSLYLNVYLYLLGKAATDELKISSLGLKDNFKVIGTGSHLSAQSEG